MSEEDHSVDSNSGCAAGIILGEKMKKRRSLKQVFSDAFHMVLNDIKSAKWAMGIIIAYFVFFKVVFHSMCPLVVITGFPCPGCGLTRAGLAVLSLDFARAWSIHPFIYPLMVLMILFCVNRYFMGKKKMPVLRVCLTVTLAAMVLFYVWRMYRYFPGEPPMSYYSENWMNLLLEKLKRVQRLC